MPKGFFTLSELTLAQAFSELDTSPAATLPWQRGLGPGALCVFPINTDHGPRFAYLRVKLAAPETPEGYLFGDAFADGHQGEAAVHPSEVLQALAPYQFHAAKVTGFRSDPEAVMAVLNYSSKRGET